MKNLILILFVAIGLSSCSNTYQSSVQQRNYAAQKQYNIVKLDKPHNKCGLSYTPFNIVEDTTWALPVDTFVSKNVVVYYFATNEGNYTLIWQRQTKREYAKFWVQRGNKKPETIFFSYACNEDGELVTYIDFPLEVPIEKKYFVYPFINKE